MPRLRAVWAIAQTCVTLATLGWAAYVLITTHEVLWGAGNAAAAVFFLVSVFLFAADHPDGRIVGLFGALVFALTNVLLLVAFLQDGLPRFEVAEFTRTQMAGILGGTTLAILVPEALLLLFGHGPLPPIAEPAAEP